MMAGGGARKRKGWKKVEPVAPIIPKHGGGVDAFRSGEARMPGERDEDDYDGLWFGGNHDMPREAGPAKNKLRWNRFKWMLFLANVLVIIYPVLFIILSNGPLTSFRRTLSWHSFFAS